MSFKKYIEPRYLLLIIPLLLSFDFLPLWFILFYSVMLVYLSFFKAYSVISYLNFLNGYFIFKTVGKVIIPETMVPFLAVFLVSRFIMNKKENKFEMYPLFLWIGVFSLFSSSFYYLLYTVITISIIFFYQQGKTQLSLRSIFNNLIKHKKQLLITTIVTAFLFIFFPRFHNFLPTVNINHRGKIGYSKTIDNSTIGNLQLSSQTAFYAELSTDLNTELLYWRGRVHTHTDGYNWKHKQLAPMKLAAFTPLKSINYTIKYEQDFDGDIILLNTPINVLKTNLNVYKVTATNEFRSYTKRKKSIISAISSITEIRTEHISKQNKIKYTQLPKFIPKALKSFSDSIKGKNAKEIITNFEKKLIQDQYTYSLQPGKLTTMKEFINKRIGYCTHYASLLGLVLRIKKIPSRLISGFQGGKYNNTGDFYEIKSNDAHAWVEYYDNNKWQMADPTGFISPNRIQLGGQEFLSPSFLSESRSKTSFLSKSFYAVKKILDTINYKASLFIDNYDKNKQKTLSKSLKINIKTFFFIGFILISLSLLFYYFLTLTNVKPSKHPADIAISKLDQKLKKYHLQISKHKLIKDKLSECEKYPHPQKLIEIIDLYTEIKYGNIKDISLLKNAIKNIS
ncbi:MAG: DUF3488 domain-containing protein [Halobacteriovoraceae bacterium]|nr:DUF3488 domain-containing protein [Halobacteriovoraceae bacterium]